MSNLPPGCSAIDIPGNRPEDFAAESAGEAALNKMHDAGLSPDEYDLCVTVGIAAVMASREAAKRAVADAMATENEWKSALAFDLRYGGVDEKILNKWHL